VITYGFEVENTGNVTLRDIVLSDPLVPGFSCTISRLLPQEVSTACSVPYRVTQADVDRGSITNEVSATSTGPGGVPVTASDSVTTPGPTQVGSLDVTKTFTFEGSIAGSNVNYTVAVANTGNVTLANVVPVDTLTRADGTAVTLNAPGLQFVGGDTDNDSALDVDEVWQYRAVYTLTQADINTGGLRNVVDVSATQPNGDPVTDRSDDGDDSDGNTEDDPTVFDIPVGPNIGAVKTVSTMGSIAGDTVVFDIVVRNLGNVDLSNITLQDDLSRADGTPIVQTNTPQLVAGDVNNDGVLNLSEVWRYQLSYTLTPKVMWMRTACPMWPRSPEQTPRVAPFQMWRTMVCPVTATRPTIPRRSQSSRSPRWNCARP